MTIEEIEKLLRDFYSATYSYGYDCGSLNGERLIEQVLIGRQNIEIAHHKLFEAIKQYGVQNDN